MFEELIKMDNKFHIFKHVHSTATCFDSYNLFLLLKFGTWIDVFWPCKKNELKSFPPLFYCVFALKSLYDYLCVFYSLNDMFAYLIMMSIFFFAIIYIYIYIYINDIIELVSSNSNSNSLSKILLINDF